MDANEAWDKFIETGRVDYYLLSRGIDVYAEGYVRRAEDNTAQSGQPSAGGGANEPDGVGNSAQGQPIG